MALSAVEKTRLFEDRHFGEHGDLSRLRINVRHPVRAALRRLTVHHNLTQTMLVERLITEADRQLPVVVTLAERRALCRAIARLDEIEGQGGGHVVASIGEI
jgi:hypothetical protein